MDRNTEIEMLSKRLRETKAELNRLFASQVELRVNQHWLNDTQEEIHVKNQELKIKLHFLNQLIP